MNLPLETAAMSVVESTSVANEQHQPVTARQIYDLVRDLIRPNPAIYWADFLVSISLGWTAFYFYLTAPNFSAVQLVGLLVASVFFYRSWIFTHELAHQGRGKLRNFRAAWNVLCGIPFMIPSFLYGDHKGHHVNHSYGTVNDAEYVPLGNWPLQYLVVYTLIIFILPVLAPIRFLLLVPVSFLHPRFRTLLWERASALAPLNLEYRRPAPSPQERRACLVQDIACTVYGWTLIGLMAAGVLPWSLLIKIYICYLSITAVNHLRALAAHRYRSNFQRSTYLEQLLDSNTFPRWPLLAALWAPLGMRYHALHHLVPSLPYHNMGIAHRRLMANLPDDSPYHQTIHAGLWSALWALVRDARTATRAV